MFQITCCSKDVRSRKEEENLSVLADILEKYLVVILDLLIAVTGKVHLSLYGVPLLYLFQTEHDNG